MSYHGDLWQEAVDSILAEGLPASLKAALDSALAHGARRAELLGRIRRQCGGRNNLTALAVEAYLGADELGRLPRD